MTKKITARFNIDPLAEKRLSGVGGYSKRMFEALSAHPGFDVTGFYFNFRHQRPAPQTKLTNWQSFNFPLKIYAKLASFGLAWPFDLFLSKVDVTFFPNFAKWPTTNSTLTITTVHDLTFLYYPELVEAKNLAHLKRVVPRALRKSDLILTVSNAVKNEIIEEYSINPDKILALPIPASNSFTDFNPKTAAKLPDVLKNQAYISFVGNFEPRKNLPTLVKAYLELPAKIRKNYKLAIAGSQSWKNEELQAIIDQANQDSTSIIQLHGLSDEEIVSFTYHSSLHIMPSFYEGFGMPVVEAMTLGTPVIVSDIPVLHESSGEAALYFDPNSPTDLAKKITEVLNNSNLQQDLIKRGRQYTSQLSWAKNADAIYQAVNSLLSR